ncbi:MAG: protein translocase subunit SecF, partial [Chloroflexi bacterium]
MVRFVERKWWYFAFSGLLIIPGLIFLLLGGLKPGIEFKGGTLLDVRFDTPPTLAEVTGVMNDLGR